MTRLALFAVIACLIMMTGCASSPPKQVENLCGIFVEKKKWYKHAKKSEKKWGSSIPVMMSIMYQESSFNAKARPPKKYVLWIIPAGRLSSAYGYPQAKDGTWDWYKKDSGNGIASRSDFGDAIDFIGWYNNKSYRTSNIKRDDAYHLYLAYHEGHGGFNRRSYRNKQWLKKVAHKVSGRAATYRRQLQSCEKSLNRRGFFGWF